MKAFALALYRLVRCFQRAGPSHPVYGRGAGSLRTALASKPESLKMIRPLGNRKAASRVESHIGFSRRAVDGGWLAAGRPCGQYKACGGRGVRALAPGW